MSENDGAGDRAGRARRAAELVGAWRLLRAYALVEPAIASALRAIDTTEMSGRIDAAAIDAALIAAQAELDRCTAAAERG
ncbi:hypothetical protein [Streptomyces sp. NPDC001889]